MTPGWARSWVSWTKRVLPTRPWSLFWETSKFLSFFFFIIIREKKALTKPRHSGQAFEEDSPVQGTYNNGHISNFRVPIIFRHPLLPRINIEANATSMSVLPTILDLLVNSKSLDAHDTSIAQDLIHDYQGQSLIRPFKPKYKGRQSWNIAIINAGGKMISVSSAATPWRVVIPLDDESQYVFSDLNTDPNELDTLSAWKVSYLLPAVKSKHGVDAKQWLKDADEVAHWWVKEMHHLWNYHEDSD